MCGTSASSEPSVTTSVAPISVATPVTRPLKAFQRRLGSVPDEQNHIALLVALALDARVVERILGPVEVALPVDQRDLRPGHLEVEEELGIDRGEPLGMPVSDEERACERGSLAAVVPPPERTDENRLPELRPSLEGEL